MDQSRIEELAQTKVEASQHFPIRVTGHGSLQRLPELQGQRRAGVSYVRLARNQVVVAAAASTRPPSAWTIPGRRFLGGNVHGNVYMDFAGGSGTPLDLGFRLRTGEIEIDWANRSIMAGLESPIFAPREPASLAQVEFAPLSGAGNLWLWTPQVRFEQKIHFTDQTGVRAQIGAVQTNEVPPYQQSGTRHPPSRPGRAWKAASSSTIAFQSGQDGAQMARASKSRPDFTPA